jgi:hypothetical protein
LIETHTAGAIPKGHFDLDFKFFEEGGIGAGVGVGITDRLNIGIAYQIMRLIGQERVGWQPFPGGQVKYRLVEESYYFPAIALGFDSQGSGPFYHHDSLPDRFYFKSKGFFGAVSKGYLFLGIPFGLHGELNYSAVENQVEGERDSPNNALNFALGLDLSLNEEISGMVEYDAAIDDNYTNNPLKGYLNACFRWAVVKGFVLEIDFKDILEHKAAHTLNGGPWGTGGMVREARIVYLEKF